MLQWLCVVTAEGEGVAAHLNYVSHTLGVSCTFCFTLYHHDYCVVMSHPSWHVG